ncbi:MAG: DnaJ domain-containing protein, partial [Myxococcales bacterium]|nr:DnaJ domain-containing protein [Myxococcales bacterium]
PGAHPELLSECALDESEVQLVNRAQSNSVREVLDSAASDHFAPVLYALLQLGVLESLAPARHSEQPSSPEVDRLDDEAMRERVVARRRLVDEADYFTLLGLTRDATAYDIRRAYLELRREFEPNHLLTARIADLADDVQLIVEVLDEAYDVLRDDVRRERYRRAIQATPA